MADAERNLRAGTKAKRSNRPDVNHVERNAKNMSKKSEMVVEPKGNDPKTDVDVNLTKIRFVNEDAIILKAGSSIENGNVVEKESSEPNNTTPNESNNIDELQLKNFSENIVEFKKNNENNCNNKADHVRAAMSPHPITTSLQEQHCAQCVKNEKENEKEIESLREEITKINSLLECLTKKSADCLKTVTKDKIGDY